VETRKDWDASMRVEWNIDPMIASVIAIDKRLLGNGLKNGVDKAARITARVMKALLTRKRTGLLGRSIGVKVSRRSNGNVYAKIGPRRKFVGLMYRFRRKGSRHFRSIRAREAGGFAAAGYKITKTGAVTIIKPTKYAHLVERGHGGPHPARGYPFMKPAMDITRKQGIDTINQAVAKVLNTTGV